MISYVPTSTDDSVDVCGPPPALAPPYLDEWKLGHRLWSCGDSKSRLRTRTLRSTDEYKYIPTFPQTRFYRVVVYGRERSRPTDENKRKKSANVYGRIIRRRTSRMKSNSAAVSRTSDSSADDYGRVAAAPTSADGGNNTTAPSST